MLLGLVSQCQVAAWPGDGDVEYGPQSLGSDRDGPYATEADARRAPEIARERARAWAADEEE